MLTGQRLFTGENDVAILERLQRTGAAPPPSRYNPEVSSDLDALSARLLERDPGRRLASAARLGREIDSLLRDERATERSGLLADLIRELFGSVQEGTGVLPAPPAATPDSRGEDSGAGAGSIEPVGPDTGTRPEPERIRGPRQSWLWPLAGIGLVTVLVAVALILFPRPGSRGEEAQPADAVASPGAPAGLSVEPVGADEPEAPAVAAPAPDGGGEQAAAPAARVAPRRPGRLDLNVIPWARVYWRKKLLGETPLEGKILPAGKHALLLINEELGVRRNIRVHIRPNRVTQRVVDLRQGLNRE
jgi:serine/threonine-protein kinase